jgi:hypothetical protein
MYIQEDVWTFKIFGTIIWWAPWGRVEMKGLLTCDISDGMFPTEKLVSFTTYSGEQVQLFAPEGLIRDGKLEVSIIQQQDTLALVRLPVGSTNSPLTVVVSADKLKSMVAA